MRTFYLTLFAASLVAAQDLRFGIIGTDTSHAGAFAKTLNEMGDHVTAAYKGGSPDIEESASRVDKYAQELQDKYGVKIVDKISDLCPLVDAILLESVDGRPHLAQFREAAACAKPVFIDKPLAASLEDAKAIAQLAREKNIPWFSSSSLRYGPTAELVNPDTQGAIVWGPGPTESHHKLELTWYGIHAVEMIYTLLGPGCVEVSATKSADEDVIVGRWKDGKLGTVHLQRPYGKFGAVIFLKKSKLAASPEIAVDYVPLVKEIVSFVQTKKPPVPNDVTLEIFAFMDAAQRSEAASGKAMPLAQ